jgi:hypothetical protein
MCPTTTASSIGIILAVTVKVIEVKVIKVVSLQLSISTSTAVIATVRLKYRRNCIRCSVGLE